MRAFLMAGVLCFALLVRRRVPFAVVFAISCGAIFILEPLDSLSPGFRLSFAAVAIIAILAASHIEQLPIRDIPVLSVGLTRVLQLGKLQIALLFGLFPLTVLIFGRVAVAAPAVNMVILPIFNVVTVPLTLLGVLLEGPFVVLGEHQCLVWAHQSVNVVLRVLTLVDDPIRESANEASGGRSDCRRLVPRAFCDSANRLAGTTNCMAWFVVCYWLQAASSTARLHRHACLRCWAGACGAAAN